MKLYLIQLKRRITIHLVQQNLTLLDDEILIVLVELDDLRICFLECEVHLDLLDDLTLIWKTYFDDDNLEVLVDKQSRNTKNQFL
jgi:hypothetical protein